MKFKRGISLALALAILSGMGGPLNIRAAAADAGSSGSSDALAALGIDTSKVPDGFDQSDKESNPYGRKTMAVTPVYELYTVGLEKDALAQYDKTIELKGKQELQTGTNKTKHEKETPKNTLTSVLYGDDDTKSKDASALLGNTKAQQTANLGSGTTTTTGNYTTISTGSADGNGKYAAKDYLTGINNASTDLGKDFSFAMSSVAAGSFTTKDSVQSDQIAMVYATDYSANSGLYLRFGDAKTGNFGAPIELLGKDKQLGNPDLVDNSAEGSGEKVENFAENPYQLKNYLQVATGDWNGDGYDEVAVYVPEVGNSRIEFYAHKSGDLTSPANWSLAWTYYFKEDNVVSNMISIVSGDVNRDGIDDLACTWGYYYGPNLNKGSRAVVMFGATGTDMLAHGQEFSLVSGSSNLVRASFAFGDLTGGGDTLILCAQSDADLKANKPNTRYVALYNWDGKEFTANNLSKNFDLFETTKDENTGKVSFVNTEMGRNGRTTTDPVFHSLPLCPANTAIIPRSMSDQEGTTDLLYFDSLIISVDEKAGLVIKQARDNMDGMPGKTGKDYVEYSAAAGAVTGYNSAGTLFTLTQVVANSTEKTAEQYTTTGKITVPNYVQESYYKNWFHKLIRKRSYRWVQKGTKEIDGTLTHNEKYTQRFAGQTSRVMLDLYGTGGTKYQSTPVNSSYALCLANTDNDTSYMEYTGNHYFTYSDPQVLAVLASPPYFSDLLGRNDLSGNYAESTTSYESSTGTGSSKVSSSTISIGAYVSFEQEFSVFGVKIGQAEAEAQYTAGFTYETEDTSSIEQSVTYNATSGEDEVAFYSIPMEIYVYNSYVADPNEKSGYKKITSTVTIPHEATIKLLSLSDYEAIAEDYSVLPSISGSVLTHTIGDPSTYPTVDEAGKYSGAYLSSGVAKSVGYTDKDGGNSITQSISFTKEAAKSYTTSNSIETKAGAGAGGLTVGVVAGSESSAGQVQITTEGSTVTGDLQDMPIEAKDYGYAMNWKIFTYNYRQGTMSFPVVSYALSEVTAPSPLPDDFEQDVADTTADSIKLTWSYDKVVSGFEIYRYYNFPEGSGSRKIADISFASGKRNEDGTYEFSFEDKDGLSPYTKYEYQIKTCNENKGQGQKSSIYSEPLECYTKTDKGYPDIKLSINSGTAADGNATMDVYPDSNATAEVKFSDPKEGQYKSISYMWQKLNSKGGWDDMNGRTTPALTIANASASDKGTYRCRVNLLYYNGTEYTITAYSPQVTTSYSKRTPDCTLTAKPGTSGSNQENKALDIQAKITKSQGDTQATGSILFTISGKDFSRSQSAELTKGVAALKDFVVPKDGAYTVSVYYSGDKVFKGIDNTVKQMVIVGTGTGYQLALTDEHDANVSRFTYGDTISAELTRKVNNTDAAETVSNAVYKYFLTSELNQKNKDGTPIQPHIYDLKTDKPNVGTYTLYAYEKESDFSSSNISENVAAETEFTVVPRAVTIRTETPSAGVSTDAIDLSDSTQLNFTCADSKVKLGDLQLDYTIVNSAGSPIEKIDFVKDKVAPSNYTITPCKSANEALNTLYANYEFTFVSGIYRVNGLTYRLTLEPQNFSDASDASDAHSVASATIMTVGSGPETGANGSSSDTYTPNTPVKLTVNPDTGYSVAKWVRCRTDGTGSEETIVDDNNLPVTANYVTIQTKAYAETVKVYFQIAKPILNAKVNDERAGTISCEEVSSFPVTTSKNSEFTFTAKPNPGWHFNQWVRKDDYQESVYSSENPLTIRVGVPNVTVTAYFVRDDYTLTLDGNLNARYTTKDSENKAVTHIVTDKATLPGDTQITVAPKPGYAVAENAKYQVNGTEVDFTDSDKGEYTFFLTENTTIQLETTRSAYAVNASVDDAEHGTVSVLVDGSAPEDAEKIPGNSKVEIKAHANRGWRFVKWVDGDGNDISVKENSTAGVYTIDELDNALTIKAVFEKNDKYTATANVSPANRGKMQYTLYDIYGDEVETKDVPENGVDIYKGEQILFTVVPNKGSSVEKWFENGTSYPKAYGKNNPSGKLTAEGNITATAQLQSAAQYQVYYDTNNITAAADNQSFETGKSLDNQSELTFTASVPDDQMVDYWTITSGDFTQTENDAAVTKDGVAFVDPVFPYTLDGNKSFRVHFAERSTKTVSIKSNEAGSGAVTYTTPIQPNTPGSLTEVRTNGTVKMTLTPTAPTYVGTADEVKSRLEKLLNGKVSVVEVTANETNTSFDVILRRVTDAIEIDPSALFDKTYTATAAAAENGTVTAPTARFKAGETVTLTVKPDNGYQLKTLTLTPADAKLNETVSKNTLTYTFTMPASDVTAAATFEKQPSSSSGGAGGGGGAGGAVTPSKDANTITASDGTKYTVSVTVKDGTASVTADSSKLTGASGKDSLSLTLTGDKTVHTVTFTGSMVSAMAGAKNGAELILPTGTITLDRDTLTALASAAKADDTIAISIKSAESSALNDAQRKLLPKNSTLLDAAAYIQTKNGTQSRVHELNGKALVSIPYALKQNETAAHLVAYYLAENGSFEKLAVTYDAKTGMASFYTSHFSDFVVTHEYSSDFTDVALDKWFYNEVNTALANGWFKGTSDTTFSPNTGMTRAMLVQVLYRMSGNTASANAQFSDVAADKWYAEAIAWASANGIVTGYSDGTFKPDALVTRQQLAAILYRYDAFTGHTPTSSTTLDAFTDAASVESWAADAMRWANGTGLVTGVTPTTLVPNGTATRAQVAVILSRYTGK